MKARFALLNVGDRFEVPGESGRQYEKLNDDGARWWLKESQPAWAGSSFGIGNRVSGGIKLFGANDLVVIDDPRKPDRVINLTPHSINLPDRVIPASGQIARCAEVITGAGRFDGIGLIKLDYGAVEGLPSPEMGVLYIVSALVRLACQFRSDLASPGTLSRDENGKVVGCQNLVVNR